MKDQYKISFFPEKFSSFQNFLGYSIQIIIIILTVANIYHEIIEFQPIVSHHRNISSHKNIRGFIKHASIMAQKEMTKMHKIKNLQGIIHKYLHNISGNSKNYLTMATHMYIPA